MIMIGVKSRLSSSLASTIRNVSPTTRASASTATGGKPRTGMRYQSFEGDLAAVDTAVAVNAFGGNAQTVAIPQGAAELDMIDIGLSLDVGAAVASVRGHCQVELLGEGMPGGPHGFGGPAVSVQGVTSGNAMVEASKRYENVNIAVVSGGTFTIRGVLIGEDPGDATVCVTLGFILA